jgi:DNA primase
MNMIFEKGKVLYGENLFTGKDTLLLVESPLDVAWAFMAGLDGDCDIGGMFGATLTKEQERIAQTYEYVILAFDNDNAGAQGKESAIARLMGHAQIYTFDNWGKKDLGQCTLEEVQAMPTRLEKVTYSKFKNLQPME